MGHKTVAQLQDQSVLPSDQPHFQAYCFMSKDEHTAFLSNGVSLIKVILPKARSHEKSGASASLRSNRLSEVWRLDSLCSGQEPVTYVVQDEK